MPDALLKIQGIRAARKQILQKYELDIDVKKTCPCCKEEFLTRFSFQEYCQNSCAKKAQRRATWPTKEELQVLILERGWEDLGKRFKVTGNTVKGWAVSYGLDIPARRRPVVERACDLCRKMYKPENKVQKYCSSTCRSTASRKVVRPPLSELLELRKSESLKRIGARYGVNWCTVKEWIKTYPSEPPILSP
jgi:hypothetical protein